jgi:hypothetical protein
MLEHEFCEQRHNEAAGEHRRWSESSPAHALDGPYPDRHREIVHASTIARDKPHDNIDTELSGPLCREPTDTQQAAHNHTADLGVTVSA